MLERSELLRGITVGPAHKYQGDERDIMIFSAVVSRGISPSAARWVESPPNLVNVAVTRAREALFLVADYEVCRRQPGILRQLVDYVETVDRLRATSLDELELFSWMVVQGWNPEVHKIVGDIEVDFVLSHQGARLAVEVDGQQHEQSREADKARDAFLRGQGYDVLRVPARSVRETPADVLHEIAVRLDIGEGNQ
jgi:very-short-patch-repair endonuclease